MTTRIRVEMGFLPLLMSIFLHQTLVQKDFKPTVLRQ